MEESGKNLVNIPSSKVGELSAAQREFLLTVDLKEKPEDKLELCLQFMRSALKKEGNTPVFKDFWTAKNLALTFFKGHLPPRVRTSYWEEYLQLSQEIIRLKQTLEEESLFAEEQISLAIAGVEQDLSQLEEKVKEKAPLVFPEKSLTLETNKEFYLSHEKEIALLSGFAIKVTHLRKELIKTPMRIRFKNRLFDRLIKLGDQIFPRKKELIHAVSQTFQKDVEQFASEYFSSSLLPFFSLKEEIKLLQSMSKSLSLTPAVFRETRGVLSQCWDKVRQKEIEHKDERAVKKVLYKENFDKIVPKIEALEKKGETLALKEIEKQSREILEEMKQLELGKIYDSSLKQRLFEIKKRGIDRDVEEKHEKKLQKEKGEKLQLEAQKQFSSALKEVLSKISDDSLELLVEKWEVLLKERNALVLTGVEEVLIENRLGLIADRIQEMRGETLLEEAPADYIAVFKEMLQKRREVRRQMKEVLESHRKIVGGSHLNLEQSMDYQTLIQEERARLESLEIVIEAWEEKLFDLEE